MKRPAHGSQSSLFCRGQAQACLSTDTRSPPHDPLFSSIPSRPQAGKEAGCPSAACVRRYRITHSCTAPGSRIGLNFSLLFFLPLLPLSLFNSRTQSAGTWIRLSFLRPRQPCGQSVWGASLGGLVLVLALCLADWLLRTLTKKGAPAVLVHVQST
ncbi:hypothetical protein V8C44DRAFT_334593 [Trichoderma aethiopicum]